MMTFFVSCALHFLILSCLTERSHTQSFTSSCSQYLRGTHRMGPNVQGRLEIPTDNFYPKYKIKVGFSAPIHHMTIRQSRAKDMGNHQDFVVDPMEMRKNGKLHLDVFIRLRGLFGPVPRVSRIVYNNEVLCGDALDVSEIEDAFVTESSSNSEKDRTTTSALSLVRVTNGTTTLSWKTKIFEDEDIFRE